MVAISKLVSSASAIAFVMMGASAAWAQELPADDTAAQSDEEIVVTGSSIRGVPPTGSNLISLTRDDIQMIGAATTPELLASVPQLNSFNTSPRAAGGGPGAFAPGLRSLPASATLPLMNGHRLVGGAVNQTNPDFPFLPDLAIERVEIVADGASAVYGSDAVAGVVNFITLKRFSGVQASVRGGMADDFDTFSASVLAGHDWGSGSIVAAYQYSENGHITGADRDYRVVDFRPYGGVDTRTNFCPTPNVLVNTTGYVVSYAAPALAAGTTNLCDNGLVTDLVPRSRLHSAYVTARQEIGSHVTVWAELLYSDRKDTVQAPPPPASSGVLLYNIPGFSTNPFFRTPPGTGATIEYVLFRTDALYGSDHIDNTYHVRTGNSSAGIDIALGGDLKLSIYGTLDWARNDSYLPAVSPAALTAAGASSSAATALDPFGNGTSAATAAAITNYAGDLIDRQRTRLGAARLDGTVIELPGGPLKIAVGAEYRRETFQQRGIYGGAQVPEDLGRNIESVYGELYLPIFGAGNETTLMRSLVLSVSGRYDHYSDFGSTTNPKIGLTWEPISGLTLRGSYGQSFRAPGLRDVGATVGAYYLSAAAVGGSLYRDPTRGAAQVDTILVVGGNKNLQPEEARTWSVGADFRPVALPNFRASITFYDIHYTNVIATPGGSIAFTDPTFASIVYRNPTTTQLSTLLALGVPVNFTPGTLPAIGNLLDFRQGNFGVRDTNGLDFDVSYRQPTRFGSVFAGLAGNYILKFDTQLSPTAPISDQLILGVPKATLRGTLGAQAGIFSVVSFVNYRAGVTGLYGTPTGTATYTANPYTTFDLRVVVAIPDTGLTSGTQLSLQINDLFDRTPPFFPATDGIGGAYNPIGRFVALSLRTKF